MRVLVLLALALAPALAQAPDPAGELKGRRYSNRVLGFTYELPKGVQPLDKLRESLDTIGQFTPEKARADMPERTMPGVLVVAWSMGAMPSAASLAAHAPPPGRIIPFAVERQVSILARKAPPGADLQTIRRELEAIAKARPGASYSPAEEVEYSGWKFVRMNLTSAYTVEGKERSCVDTS